jgi:nucleoside-diphosphate-sugar epimerase
VPIIVIGADTPIGVDIITELARSTGEVRAFITDPGPADCFRRMGCKVAMGDVSDGSHIEIAAFECFTAVLIAEAATDGRERSFADDPEAVAVAWMEAIRGARIHRLIWIGSDALPGPPDPEVCPEIATLSEGKPGVPHEVARLNEAETLD